MAGKQILEEALASYDDSAIIRTCRILLSIIYLYVLLSRRLIFVVAHFPFPLDGQSVRPVRLALATLWSICNNGAYSWYEVAVALLDYVREQFPDVSTPSYDRFMVDIRLKVLFLQIAVKGCEVDGSFSTRPRCMLTSATVRELRKRFHD